MGEKKGIWKILWRIPQDKIEPHRMLVRHPGNQCAQSRDLQRELKNLSQFLRPGLAIPGQAWMKGSMRACQKVTFTQIPHPMQSSSEIQAAFEFIDTSTHSFPALRNTPGHTTRHYMKPLHPGPKRVCSTAMQAKGVYILHYALGLKTNCMVTAW